MSNTPTCLCTDAVFWNEPCPAHPKPQADKTIDELERDIAIEVGIVYKHSKLGTDYTVNCTNVILSLCEHYSEALATEARIDGAVMGAKFGNAAFRQQSIAKPGEQINLDTVRESGIKQAKEWAERNVE